MPSKLVTGLSALAAGALLIAACGGGAATTPPTKAPETQAPAQTGAKTDTKTDAKPDTKAAAPQTAGQVTPAPAVGSVGVTDTEIKIGTWLAQSGPAASYITIGQGWDAVFKKVNDEGGIHGRKVNAIWLDDAYDPARTPGVVRQLIEQEQVFALNGGGGTPTGLAVLDYILASGVPHFFPTTGASVWANPLKKTYFALATNYVDDGFLLGEYAINELQAKKIGIVYQNDAFGLEGVEGFKKAFAKHNLTAAVEIPTQPADTDMSSVVLRLRQAQADTVLIYMITRPAALLFKEAQKQGLKINWVCFYGLADPSTIELAGGAAEGAIMSTWLPLPDSDDPGIQNYKATVTKYYPQVVIGNNSEWGYTNAQLMVEALQRTGPNLTRERLIETVESMQNVDLDLVKGVSFSPTDHQGYKSIALVQVKDGKFVQIAPFRSVQE